MRPESIRQFEYFYLGSIAVALVNFVLNLAELGPGIWASGPFNIGEPGSPLSTVAFVAIVIACLIVAAVIPLALWYFAARRASEVAKWLIVALGAFGALRMLLILFMLGVLIVTRAPTTTYVWLTMLLSFVTELLHLAAIAFLFPADSREWFARRGVGIRAHEDIFG